MPVQDGAGAFKFNDASTVQQTELIDRVANQIRRWGATGLAVTLLEGLRPLAPIGGQMLWIAQPTLGLLADSERLAQYARLLEQPEMLDLLRDRLEAC